MTEGVQSFHLGVPLSVELRCPLSVPVPDRPATEQLDQTLESGTSVAHESETSVLGGVEVGNVHVQKTHVVVLERRLRGGGEVRPACSYPDHEIGLGSHTVG